MIYNNFDLDRIIKKSQKKRIGLVFNHPFFLGGGEISFFELIRSLDRKLIEPIVFVPASGEIENELYKLNCKAYICPIPSLKKISYSIRPITGLIKIVKLFRENNIQVIHVNGSRACFYGGLAGRILGIPVIWHVRETKKDLFFYEYFLLILAKVIICVSKSVKKKRFGKFNSKIHNKIEVIYNGVDTAKFTVIKNTRQSVRKNLGIDKQVLIGIIGNIVPLKGHDFFIKGFAKAKNKNPNLRAKILIIGRSLDTDYKNYIHKLVYDFNLDNEVIFKKYSENIFEIFSALDILALPSKREGFSRSLIEAMSMELPILATKISEIEEAVQNGKNAILVHFNDIDNLASAIIRLYERKKLREQMGANNRKRVKEEFNLRSHIKSIMNIYDKL